MTVKTVLTENWNEQKAKLKKKFPVLTDKDLFFEIGRKNEMLATLHGKVGKSKEEFQKIIEEL